MYHPRRLLFGLNDHIYTRNTHVYGYELMVTRVMPPTKQAILLDGLEAGRMGHSCVHYSHDHGTVGGSVGQRARGHSSYDVKCWCVRVKKILNPIDNH